MGDQQAIYAGVALLVAILGAILICRKRFAPRGAYRIDHFRIELHDAHVIDDRIIEAVWRAAISMTNRTRQPRRLPILAERATVIAGSRTYIAYVYLETTSAELNPDDTALAWVEFVLPAGASPRSCSIVHLRHQRRPRRLRFTQRELAQRSAVVLGGRARHPS